jgi:hypothetical protein
MAEKDYLGILIESLLKTKEKQGGEIKGDWVIKSFQVPGLQGQELLDCWDVEIETYYIGPKNLCYAVTSQNDGSHVLYFLVTKYHTDECGEHVASFTLKP